MLFVPELKCTFKIKYGLNESDVFCIILLVFVHKKVLKRVMLHGTVARAN
jgi:hypothetical protein